MRNILIGAVVGLTLLLPTTIKAQCLDPAAESRLQVYCLSGSLAGAATTLQSAQVLDFRLKQEGYIRGIGLPGSVRPLRFSLSLSPILEQSADINGGNPDRPLVLGSLTFFGDEEFFRKEGVIAGAGVGGMGRAVYGEGRYLDFSLGVSYAHSPSHKIGIARAYANLCSKNDIGRNFYFDACLVASRVKRDLSDETNSSATLSAVRLFATDSNRFHQLSAGVRRIFAEEYSQHQLLLNLKTLHGSGFYTEFSVLSGESVFETLALRHSVSATIGASLFNRPIRSSFSYSYSDGGKLLGFSREDATQAISVTYSFHPRVNLSVSYKDTSSSINYFNESETIFGIQFAPILF